MAQGDDGAEVARQLIAQLDAPDLVLALVFHDWRIDPHVLSRTLQAGLPDALTAGCTTFGVIGPGPGSAAAIGLYGDWVRAGLGIASELSKSPLTRSRDAVHAAAAMLGHAAGTLDPVRHVGIMLLDGTSGHGESFCIGSAAAAPQIRVVGGCAGTELDSARSAFVWARGEALADAGLVLILDSKLACHALRSSHVVATEIRTVVTAASGRRLEQLDGRPATQRLRELVGQLGETLAPRPAHTFARFVDGIPYVRSIVSYDETCVTLATAVEPGHVLRLMRPGDLIGTTRRDLAVAAERVGGSLGAVLAFSCAGRHWEAADRGLATELAAVYAAHPTIGCQSMGEQSGMLLVNHTLTGLAIGAAP